MGAPIKGKYNIHVYDDGDTYRKLNGRNHCDTGPAIELCNGHKEWWIEGLLHREDGPAVEFHTGNKMWYLEGEGLTEEAFENERLQG